MESTGRTVHHLIDEQVKKWEISRSKKKEENKGIQIITISREPGSGGRIVAGKLAEKIGFDLFNQELVNEIADSAKMSEKILETLDEKGLNLLQEWSSYLIHEKHLWPDQYLKHLIKVIGTIRTHGRAVIVGRGAHFVIPPEGRLRVRIVAPRKLRIRNVSREFSITSEEAEHRILKTESDRRAFVRKYFYSDISDPTSYDMVFNTELLSVDSVVDTIRNILD